MRIPLIGYVHLVLYIIEDYIHSQYIYIYTVYLRDQLIFKKTCIVLSFIFTYRLFITI